MAKIPVTSGFAVHPEGDYVFTIADVKYDAEFGTMEFDLKSEKGVIHKKYNMMAADGSMNTGACNSFSYLARNALNDWESSEIESDDLPGKQIKATVVHDKRPSTKDPSKTVTFCNLDNVSSVDSEYDIDALLN